MEPLSICLVVRDAAALLPACLASFDGLSPDIVVVVDDRTADDSLSVAARLGARAVTHKFIDFASQKNFALSLSRHDWNLFVDADERLTPALVAEISRVLSHPAADGYFIPRLNYIFGRPIYHTNWDPNSDSHIWLFRKSAAAWSGRVHEEVIISGRAGRLRQPKIHLAYASVEDFISKLNLYTSLESASQNPGLDFFRRYIWHLGFLDGWHGLFLSYLMVIYHLSASVKLWQKKSIPS